MRRILVAVACLAGMLPCHGQVVLIEDVRLFDGVNADLRHGHVLVKEKGAVISTQLYIFRNLLDGEYMTDFQKEKGQLVRAGQENLIRLLKKYDITTGFSTDFIFGEYQALPLEFVERAGFWSNAEVLRQATAEGGEIIRMAGKLNRYGNFGETREVWVADLLLHNGEVLDDLSVLADPETNLALIMQGGKIVKRQPWRRHGPASGW